MKKTLRVSKVGDTPNKLRLSLYECNSTNTELEISPDIDLLDSIRDKIKFKNPKYGIIKSSFIQEFTSPISEIFTFNAGLLKTVVKIVEIYFSNIIDIKLDSDIKDIALPLAEYRKIDSIVKPTNSKFEYRPYQLEAIENAIKSGRGVINLPTGSGKSLVIYGLIINLREILGKDKVITIVVPNNALCVQMKKDFVEYGCDESIIGELSSNQIYELDSKVKILLITSTYVLNRQEKVKKYDQDKFSYDEIEQLRSEDIQKKKDKIKILKSNGVVLSSNRAKYVNSKSDAIILDECHCYTAGSKIFNVLNRFDTSIRFGLTATLPSDKLAHYSIIGLIGPLLIKMVAKELLKDNVLAKINLWNINFVHQEEADISISDKIKQYCEDPKNKLPYELLDKNKMQKARLEYQFEVDYVKNCFKTNYEVCSLFSKLPGNSIIMYDFTQHGENLFNILTENIKPQKRVFWIYGKTENEDREKIRNLIEANSDVLLVANCKCFGTGTNIKAINNLGFVFSSKSNIKIIQSIGRALRTSSTKKHANIFDFTHSLRFSQKHYIERKKMYVQQFDISEEDQNSKRKQIKGYE